MEVCFDSQTSRDSLEASGGYWLEVLTAHAFQAAGADEVRYGIKWRWTSTRVIQTYHRARSQMAGARRRSSRPSHRTVSEPHMVEVDVVARFQHRFVVISCKTGQQPTTAAAKREIEAVAGSMGRFSIPILVRPLLDESLVENSLRAPKGAALLDLRNIADPQKLKEALQKKFEVFRG